MLSLSDACWSDAQPVLSQMAVVMSMLVVPDPSQMTKLLLVLPAFV
jgi:hypothetical protein